MIVDRLREMTMGQTDNRPRNTAAGAGQARDITKETQTGQPTKRTPSIDRERYEEGEHKDKRSGADAQECPAQCLPGT